MAYQLVNVFRTDYLGKTIEGLTDAQRELIDIVHYRSDAEGTCEGRSLDPVLASRRDDPC